MGRRVVVLALSVLLLAVAWPAKGSITSPRAPFAQILVDPTPDPFTVEIEVLNRDTDGVISKIELCTGDDSPCAATSFQHTAIEEAIACLYGSSQNFKVSHTYLAYGTYALKAKVTGTSCSVLGPEHETEAHDQIIIRDPPPPPPVPPAPDPIQCATEGDPGDSDIGVFADRIELGVVAPATGPARELMETAQGIQAAVNHINAAGGICRRELAVEIVDDGDDALRGRDAIRDFIAAGKFALIAMPSANGLDAAQNDIEQAQIPVVGTSGRLRSQFSRDWIWPIGPAPDTLGTVIARHLYDLGARTYAIIWLDLLGGFEVRDSLHRAIPELPGARVEADRRISYSEPSFESVINDVQNQCGGQMCDALVLAIDSTNAVKWSHAADRMGAHAPVATTLMPNGFNSALARDCSDACQDVYAWTGFAPPIGDAPEAATAYRNDLSALFPQADEDNALTEAAYAGTMLAALAISRVGVNLTRAGLKAVLDAGGLSVGLTATRLSWIPDPYANRHLQAYQMVRAAGSFAGWRRATDWVTDL